MLWFAFALLALVVAVPLLAVLLRPHAAASSSDVTVYRAQLAEVDRDLARGVVGAEDAQRARVEISRRLLEADRAAKAERSSESPAGARRLAAGFAALVLAGGAALYGLIGTPAQPDLPIKARIAEAEARHANRPAQAEAEQTAQLPPMPAPDPQTAALVQQLRDAMKSHPDDPQGLRLLATHEGQLGNYAAAWAAQKHLIERIGPSATAADYALLADLMISATAGYISPEAEAVLSEALKRDPKNGIARFYQGGLLAQNGREDGAFYVWDALLRDSQPSDGWVPLISQALPDLAWYAGVKDYQLPGAALPGPDAGALAAAGEMTEAQRSEMIAGMVQQLGDRLATEGGSPEEWLRYINALGVLGDKAKLGDALVLAAQKLAADPATLKQVQEAAQATGLVP